MRLVDHLGAQARQALCSMVFIMKADGADPGIVCVDGGTKPLLQKVFQGMRGITQNRAGLHIAGEIGFDRDLVHLHIFD